MVKNGVLDNVRQDHREREKELERLADEKLAQTSEMGLANRVGCITLTIVIGILAASYILEAVKGNRTIPYTITVIVLGMIQIALAWFFYNKNHETTNIKHVIGYGYGLYYTFLLFTGQNVLVFTYVIPMLIVVTLYNDYVFTRKIGISALIVNIIDVIYVAMTAELTATRIVSLEIQTALITLVAFFFMLVSFTSTKFNSIRIARLNLEKNKTEKLLEQVIAVSEDMTESVSAVAGKMVTLKESVSQTMTSMSEVTSGTNESAEAIQHQLVKTEEIQDHISRVEAATDEITADMNTTTSAIQDGQSHVDHLLKMVNISDTAGNEVAAALESFREYTDRMNSITDLITSVANQTSMLALNASIEAARAGEAGRGFAVVATQISSLAGQTKQATENITSLIGNISSQLQVMIDTINHLLNSNKEQSSSAGKTADSFGIIIRNAERIQTQSKDLTVIVSELASANKVIVDSIQTISAITEEVSAHSNETYTSSEQNQKVAEEIGQLVESLSSDADKLKKAEATM